MWQNLLIAFLGMLVDKLVWPLIDMFIKDQKRRARLKDKFTVNRKKTDAVEQAQTNEEAEDAFGKAP